jgi:hypothetical protein
LTVNDDTTTLALGESVSFQPLLNNIIPPGKAASITGLGEPLIGTATLGANNTVTYTAPVNGGSATVRFAFAVVIQDSSGTTASSQVFVTVTPGHIPPSNDFTWVTPISDVHTNCDEACSGTLGAGWRGLNGGSEEWRMCAGLVDLPEGLGQQWLVGSTVSFQLICVITCATTPCWELPAGYVREEDFVFAGAANSAQNAAGDILLKDFPLKCACTSCQGSTCDAKFWAPSSTSSTCPQPSITPQPGESFPSTVYSKICASNTDGSFGRTGWVAPSGGCSVFGTDAEFVPDYDVLCPGRP